MRRSAYLFAFALAILGCNDDTGSTETNAGDDSGSEDEVGSESESTTTGDGDGDSESDDVPDCTPGAFGCTCAEGDVCSPDLECIDGMCTFTDCPPTFDGCPCGEGDACMPGLFCVEGTCGCQPGTVGCTCIDGTSCDGEMSCIGGECWLMSSYPNCGWDAAHNYYFCGFNIAHPDWPIDCPANLVMGEPCPPELTFEGCCDLMGTWWCQGGTISFQAC